MNSFSLWNYNTKNEKRLNPAWLERKKKVIWMILLVFLRFKKKKKSKTKLAPEINKTKKTRGTASLCQQRQNQIVLKGWKPHPSLAAISFILLLRAHPSSKLKQWHGCRFLLSLFLFSFFLFKEINTVIILSRINGIHFHPHRHIHSNQISRLTCQEALVPA